MIASAVELMVKGIVAEPDQVAVTSQAAGQRLDIKVNVAAADYGRVIGRNGQTISAIRTLAALAGSHAGTTVTVDVSDEGTSAI